MLEEDKERMLIEMHQDIRWIREWICEQNKYHLMVYAALVGAVLGIIL